MQTDALNREHGESSTTAAIPLQQWAMLATAAAMLGYGISRRSRYGVVLAAAAVPVAYRGVMGQWPLSGDGRPAADGNTRTALAGERGTRVREAIRLERPIGEVYQFWRQLENLPQFMTHLVRVDQLDNGRSHWVATGPGGVNVEWDAEIINEVRDQVIAWRSLPGADVVTAGSVTFAPVRGGRTTPSRQSSSRLVPSVARRSRRTSSARIAVKGRPPRIASKASATPHAAARSAASASSSSCSTTTTRLPTPRSSCATSRVA